MFSVEEPPRTSHPHQTQSPTCKPDSDVPMRLSVLGHMGVDISDPDLRPILEETEEVKKLVSASLDDLEPDDIMKVIMRVHSLIDSISLNSDLVPYFFPAALVDYGYEVVGRAATRLSSLPEAYYDDGEGVLRPVMDLVVRLSDLSIESRIEAGDAISARDVADAVMKLMRIVDDRRRLLPIMRTLLRRGNNATREIVVANLAVLVGFDVALMWESAEYIAQRESERSVLCGFIAFLGDMIKPHPERVQELLLILHDRGSRSAGRETGIAHCGMERLITWLWIRHGQVGVRGAIQDWVDNPYAYRDEIENAIDYTSRDALVIGYNSAHQEIRDITKRAQQLYGWIATALIEGLNQYVPHVQPSIVVESDRKRVACYAKLLDSLCFRMSVATGASPSNNQKPPPLQSNASKRGFLKDMFRVLEGIGNVGAPHTVHTLIGLLSFLAPGEPETAFDLTSSALVRAGRKYGYQFEGAALDRVVRIVGYFLADHRGLFENEIRRQKLIDCLDVFVDAGWPAATRLLYRLPDLL